MRPRHIIPSQALSNDAGLPLVHAGDGADGTGGPAFAGASYSGPTDEHGTVHLVGQAGEPERPALGAKVLSWRLNLVFDEKQWMVISPFDAAALR